MSRICVIGQGYVGLVTGTGLAELGHEVIGLDVDATKIARLEQGEIPIYEPGLLEIVERNRAAGRLAFTTDYSVAVPSADFIFLAVPTPEGPSGEANLTYLQKAAAQLAQYASDSAVVAIKSTVPPGTGDRVSGWIQRARPDGVGLPVVSHPEFLREGSAVEDFFAPDRIVVGCPDAGAAAAVVGLYSAFSCPALITDRPTAEMIKYASNAFLATKISFINEISQICEKVRADVKHVAQGMGLDRRIGPQFLNAGLGYGGSCFPKDVKALEYLATSRGAHPQILHAVMTVNRSQLLSAVNRMRDLLGDLAGTTIGLLGLAFKPNTDDLRGAPAIELAQQLMREGARVVAYDPVAMPHASRLLPELVCCSDPYATASMSDGLIMVTEWDEFKTLDLARLRSAMRTPVLLDGRNFFDPAEVRRAGFVYAAIGRGYEPQPRRGLAALAAAAAESLAHDASANGHNGTNGSNGHNGTNGHHGQLVGTEQVWAA